MDGRHISGSSKNFHNSYNLIHPRRMKNISIFLTMYVEFFRLRFWKLHLFKNYLEEIFANLFHNLTFFKIDSKNVERTRKLKSVSFSNFNNSIKMKLIKSNICISYNKFFFQITFWVFWKTVKKINIIKHPLK